MLFNSNRFFFVPVAISLSSLLLGACQGEIGATGGNVASGSKSLTPAYEKAALNCSETAPIESPMRRLTPEQYRNAIHDLLPTATNFETIPRSKFQDFRTEWSSNVVRDGDESKIRDSAASIAKQISLGDIGCSDRQCIDGWIANFTKKAFRRPASAEEMAILQKVINTNHDAVSFSDTERLQMAVETLLQMPQFLYRIESGIASEQPFLELSDWDVASRLSFFLWDSVPDDTLLAKAESGQLHTAEQIEVEARRMVADPRAKQTLVAFVEDWLDLQRLADASKKKDLYPSFSPDFVADSKEEVGRFVGNLFDNNGTISDLFTSANKPINSRLAEVYEANDPGGWKILDLDILKRPGLLTTAAFALAHSDEEGPHVIQRGAFVRTELLCEDLELPTGIEVTTLPKREPGLSERERLEQHRSDPVCASCHNKMDPAGFLFQHYDALGGYRMVDAISGLEVDASGGLVEAGDLSSDLYDVHELVDRIAQSDRLSECATQKLYEYMAAREHNRFDACSLEQVKEKLKSGSGTLQQLMIAMTLSDAFRYRQNPNFAIGDE